jgi:L,D-transpeptidase catalytic domain
MNISQNTLDTRPIIGLLRAVAAVAVVALGVAGGPSVARAEGPSACLQPGANGCMYGLPTMQYQMLLTQMAAHPSPNVREIPADNREVGRYSLYRLNRAGVTLYDGPGGNPIGSIDAGFNFVGIRQAQGDWVEIDRGRWTQSSNLSAVSASTYRGVLIDGELLYPMAWILQPTRPSTIPGQKAEADTPLVDRYVRVNIFATVRVGDWDWYLIGPGQWIEQRRVGRLIPATRPAEVKGRWVAVDLYEQVAVAYEGDRMVFATLISSGLPKWSTNEGLFRIWSRFKSDTMSGAMGQPDFYRLPAVPYVMYFDQAISLHGTYWHDGFGYRHSHGCVNLSVSDSRWIFEWTNNFFADTWIFVWSSGQYGK